MFHKGIFMITFYFTINMRVNVFHSVTRFYNENIHSVKNKLGPDFLILLEITSNLWGLSVIFLFHSFKNYFCKVTEKNPI